MVWMIDSIVSMDVQVVHVIVTYKRMLEEMDISVLSFSLYHLLSLVVGLLYIPDSHWTSTWCHWGMSAKLATSRDANNCKQAEGTGLFNTHSWKVAYWKLSGAGDSTLSRL